MVEAAAAAELFHRRDMQRPRGRDALATHIDRQYVDCGTIRNVVIGQYRTGVEIDAMKAQAMIVMQPVRGSVRIGPLLVDR